ncbi:MAG TPA: VOC family protein, partial [Candidatus Eremiobacteraceae bacterium]
KMKSTTDVMLRTNDLEAAKAYYHGVLGFANIPVSDRIIGFDAGGLAIYFERGDANGSVLEFEVDDVTEAKMKLLAHGCTLVEENPAIPRCYLSDRFGLIFNLTKRVL